jgi:hypothetical protein
MEQKLGVVIQGPIMSIGRSGATSLATLESATVNDIIYYNCVDLIEEYFKKYSSEYELVVATWTTEDSNQVSDLQRRIGKDRVLLLEDKTICVPTLTKLIPANNKYRQFQSTLAGVNYLQKKKCTHIIKVRTDMMIAVEKLWADYLAVCAIRPLVVMVPWVYKDRPDFIHDFYFAMKIEDAVELISEYLIGKEIYHSVHHDLFYTWILKKGYKENSHFLHNTIFMKKLYLDVWNNVFCPASIVIFQSAIWRGEKFPYPYVYGHTMSYLDNLGESYLCPNDFFKLRTLIKKIYDGLCNRLFK